MNRTIRLDATGETVTFLHDEGSSADVLFIEVQLPGGGDGPPPHVHPLQSETFEVLEGRLGLQLGEERTELGPGEKTVVPAGALHAWWNAADGPLRARGEVRPALHFEWMLTEVFASCNRRGAAEPSIWDGAFVLSQIPGEYWLGSVPRPVQRFLFPAVALLGRMLGRVMVKPRPRLPRSPTATAR